MSTDQDKHKNKPTIESPDTNDDDFDIAVIGGEDTDSLTELFGAMRSVNTSSQFSRLNETTIDDGNGGKIELDLNDDNLIKK